MNSKTYVIATAIAVSGLTLTLNATGATESQLPAKQKMGEVTYIMGGVGQTEAAAIEHVAKYYPLELEFLQKAKSKNEYLSDVQVRIKDAHDKMVLNVTANGPFLLAKMPDGKYTVSAEREHKVEHRQIKISAKDHQRVVFEWQS